MNPGAGARALPRITVIIAVRNGAKTLQRALDSVFEQTYADIELVVQDGASTDGTQAILERNTARIAYWRSEPDRGIYQAWNKALDHVTGDWICFLGADDRFRTPDVMVRVAAALAEDEMRHRIAYGDMDKILADGSIRHRVGAPWDDARRARFRRGFMIPHPSTFHHRSLFDMAGRFDETFVIAGDFEFLLRELLDHDPLFIPVVVTDMTAGGLSDRPSSAYRVPWEVHRARYLHSLVPTPPWRSRRLARQMASIWIARNIRPRLAAVRRLAARRSR